MSHRIFSQLGHDDQDDEEEALSKAALPIGKTKPDMVNGIPVGGEDYLLLVRQQAKSCAQTAVAPPPKEQRALSLPPQYQFFQDTESRQDVLPDPDWATRFGESFKSYQQYMQKNKEQRKPSKRTYPKKSTLKDDWYAYCYKGELELSKLDQVTALSQNFIVALLKYHRDWITEMTRTEALWLFTLLLYLDPVMTGDTTSVLRDIARKCIQLRNSKDPSDEAIPRLNIIITIIAKAFGQADLV